MERYCQFLKVFRCVGPGKTQRLPHTDTQERHEEQWHAWCGCRVISTMIKIELCILLTVKITDMILNSPIIYPQITCSHP